MSRVLAKISFLTEVTISTAADGVGARKSATGSHNVVSVSCPTAETIGIRDSETFLTKFSSLK